MPLSNITHPKLPDTSPTSQQQNNEKQQYNSNDYVDYYNIFYLYKHIYFKTYYVYVNYISNMIVWILL